MKALRHTSLFILIICALSSCSVDPQAIAFGSDQCEYCSMNIVDQMHAGQYVTLKGKQFKFDAIECMIAQLKEVDEKELSTILISDYGAKGAMCEAQDASYLISKKIKSPMGACLSGFKDADKARSVQEEYSGTLFDWEGIKLELAE